MAHFAKINEQTNEVEQVIVISNEDCNNLPFPDSEPIGQQFIQNLGLSGVWKQTSYNNNFRKQYAGLGYTYNTENDVFISPKPYPSWILNETDWTWEAPLPYPNDVNGYIWDEDTLNWIEGGLN